MGTAVGVSDGIKGGDVGVSEGMKGGDVGVSDGIESITGAMNKLKEVGRSGFDATGTG
jgi:hypothetical protein